MRAPRLVIVLLLVLTFGAGAVAQPNQPGAQPTTPPAEGTPPAPDGAAQQQLTPAQRTSEGEAILRRAVVTQRTVRTMLEAARKEGDIIRTECLDDKFTQINATLRGIESRLEKLRAAVDPGQGLHEYTVLTVLGQKMNVLDQEAHQCVGEAMYETGQTTVVTEIDTEMLPFGEDNPSTPPVVPPPSLPFVPPPATGTR